LIDETKDGHPLPKSEDPKRKAKENNDEGRKNTDQTSAGEERENTLRHKMVL
jgi:hypothetical protein